MKQTKEQLTEERVTETVREEVRQAMREWASRRLQRNLGEEAAHRLMGAKYVPRGQRVHL